MVNDSGYAIQVFAAALVAWHVVSRYTVLSCQPFAENFQDDVDATHRVTRDQLHPIAWADEKCIQCLPTGTHCTAKALAKFLEVILVYYIFNILRTDQEPMHVHVYVHALNAHVMQVPRAPA